jgi:hypothetical protein
MTVAFLDRSAPTPRITYCFDVGDIHFHEYYYSFVLIMQQETACRHQTRQHLVVWLLSLRWFQFLHENRDRLLTRDDMYAPIIIVFRDTIYVIIILYSWHLVICEHFWPYVWNNWSWVMHMMSTWFWHKNRVWQKWYQSCVNHRNASLDRRVLFLVLF